MSDDIDAVQVVVAIWSWATLKPERTEKSPVPNFLARGFSLRTAFVKKYGIRKGKQIMEKKDLEKRLNSLAMAGRDIQEAMAYLCEIKKRELDFHYYNPSKQEYPLFEALVLALSVSYARAFSKNADRDGVKAKNIPKSYVPEKYKTLHRALMTLRDKQHAHSDMDAMGFSHLYNDEWGNDSWLTYGMSYNPPLDPWKENWKDEVGNLLREVSGKISEEGRVLWDKRKVEVVKDKREIREAERRLFQ